MQKRFALKLPLSSLFTSLTHCSRGSVSNQGMNIWPSGGETEAQKTSVQVLSHWVTTARLLQLSEPPSPPSLPRLQWDLSGSPSLWTAQHSPWLHRVLRTQTASWYFRDAYWGLSWILNKISFMHHHFSAFHTWKIQGVDLLVVDHTTSC